MTWENLDGFFSKNRAADLCRILLGAPPKAAARWAALFERTRNKILYLLQNYAEGIRCFFERQIGWRNYQMKASILLPAALSCRGISATFADASQATNDKSRASRHRRR
ncbi:hypothetical protein [Pseudomonas sp.]|uniref:hypothetical protein n=1 Tax=Pseudomonas sp. TaxID=306 RepID=UPI002E323ECD|nr:hypothetical protein [Pseudomonas sp.]HEX4548956.1 hypothetical protein [Pseudomonas sp.]